MNKKLANLRAEQKLMLAEKNIELGIIENKISAFYKAHRNEPIGTFGKEISELHDAKDTLAKEVEFLTAETLEKKYANHIGWSDVNPYEVIEERTANVMVIRSMNAVEKPEAAEARKASFVPGGFCGHFDNYLQDWDITPNEEGVVITIRKHKNNRWYDRSGARYSIEASPRKFYDFNF